MSGGILALVLSRFLIYDPWLVVMAFALSLVVILFLRLWQPLWLGAMITVFWTSLGAGLVWSQTYGQEIRGEGPFEFNVKSTSGWGEDYALYGSVTSQSGKALALVIAERSYPAFSKLNVTGEFAPLSSEGFDERFAGALRFQGYRFICKRCEIEGAHVPILLEKMDAFRHYSIQKIERFFSGEQGALLVPMLFGDTSVLNSSQKSALSGLGLSHIMAVSGMNLVMVIAFAEVLLFFLPRRWRWLGLGAVVLLYSALVGFAPSIMRAALMTFVALGGRWLGRSQFSFNALLLAAWIMAIVQPGILASISFQLSFAATAGIILIAPRIAMRGALGEIIRMTIAAAIATAPLSLWHFGQVSVAGLLSNLLVVPLVPWLTVLGFIFILLPVPLVQDVIAITMRPILFFLDWLLGLAPGLPGTTATLTIDAKDLFFSYLIMALVLFFTQPVKRTSYAPD